MDAHRNSESPQGRTAETADAEIVCLARVRAARAQAEQAASGASAAGDDDAASVGNADVEAVLACLTYLREETTRMAAPATAHFLGAARVALEEETAGRDRR